MDSRERILLAMDGGTPDRVPCALGFYHLDLDQLLPPDRFPGAQACVDVNFVSFPLSPEEKALERAAGPYHPDTRLGTPAQEATYARWDYHPETPEHSSPLAGARSLDDLRRFPFPDTSTPYQSEALARQVTALHSKGLAAGGNLPHLGGELFEAAWRLRGLEPFLLDLLRRPEWVEYLLDRLAGLARRNAEALAGAGVDVLALDDDVGMPGTMIIGPETWRRFFKPRLAAIIDAARAIKPDLRVLFHSDGTITPILDDLLEIGVSALNPLQPEHMDAALIRRRYGPRLALWGTVGTQTTLSFASPEDIRREVKERIDTLGRAGLILCPAYDVDEPDIPAANVVAFVEAVAEYG
jgi:uroporphyrinogen decarboxylase